MHRRLLNAGFSPSKPKQAQLKFTFDLAQAARLHVHTCVYPIMLNLNFTHGGMRACEFF